MSVPTFPCNEPLFIPATGSWPSSHHLFDEKSHYALRAALAARRPLLVRGEPGTGKSQLARAAAYHLGRLFVSEVVHARSESQDLLWYFDAVGRLGEAQAMAAEGGAEDAKARLNPCRYLSPGALWWVFDWASALAQYHQCRHPQRRPQEPEGWQPVQGSVLLIDEIDKADSDLPNGLLETLGNGAFTVPYLDRAVGLAKNIDAPLVIVTTNEERELPAAFVRRCLVLQLSVPKEEQALIDWLMKRGEIHFPQCREKVRREAARQLWEDRREALRQGMSPPGQAEYLDILRALQELAQDEDEQIRMLDKIGEFSLKKYSQEA